jgi:hypothetical protein
MRMEDWYRGVILAWLAFGLPSMLLAIGFAGGNPFRDLELSHFSPLGIVLWFVFLTLMLAPIWLAPFGLKIAKSHQGAGEDTEI